MPEPKDFPCYIDIYKQEVVHSPHQEGFGVDEVVWMDNWNEYINWIVDIDAPLEPHEMSKKL